MKGPLPRLQRRPGAFSEQPLGLGGSGSLGRPANILGAREVVSRESVDDNSGKPLLKERWAAVVDTVGGNILSTAIRATKYRGVVTCCGNVASAEFAATVFPFILKGVSLIGVDSVQCPMEERLSLWQKLSSDWKPDNLNGVVTESSLEVLEEKIMLILQGKLRGRVVVNVKA